MFCASSFFFAPLSPKEEKNLLHRRKDDFA
jgi:hypothetical protein